MAKNIQSLQLLRNTSQLYATREAALAALTGSTIPAGAQDGTPVLARYKGEDGSIMTLVGYYAVASAITGSDTATTHMTVFDFEGSKADVEALREEINAKLGGGVTSANTATAQLAALSGDSSTSVSGDTSVEGAKRYADEKVRAGLDALDASTVSGESKVLIDVTQNNGQITASAANLTGVKLDGYTVGGDDSDKVAATDTLGTALGKLQGQINGMDKAASAEDGKVVTTISETDGVVSETKANVKDLQLGGYAKTNDTGDIASGDTINVALSKLENKSAAITIANADGSINVTTAATGTDINVNIKSGEHVLAKDGNAGLYTNIQVSAVTGTELSNLGTNVKEAYKLVGTDNTKLGEYIKIYKDSSLVNFYLGHVDDVLTDEDSSTYESPTSAVTDGSGDTALVYIMQLANGNYKLAAVNVESFLQEAEFGSGVTADSSTHVVHGVVDSASEKDSNNDSFLTVGADGFKVDGIKDEIDAKIGALDASVSGGTTAGTATSNHIEVVIDEADGKLTAVTVTETNIADADDLAELSAKTFTVATSSNASITTGTSAASDGTVSVDLITDASKIKMSGFTADASGFTAISESSSVTEAFKAVETFVLDNEQVTSSALNDLNTRLSAETAARKAVDGQNGDTYAANTTAPYISGATSLNDADIKLAEAISNLSGGYIEAVKVNNVQLAESDNKVNVQISGGTSYANSVNAINVDTDSTTGAVTLTLGTIDAGTY